MNEFPKEIPPWRRNEENSTQSLILISECGHVQRFQKVSSFIYFLFLVCWIQSLFNVGFIMDSTLLEICFKSVHILMSLVSGFMCKTSFFYVFCIFFCFGQKSSVESKEIEFIPKILDPFLWFFGKNMTCNIFSS